MKSFTTTHGHTAFTYEKTLIILGFHLLVSVRCSLTHSALIIAEKRIVKMHGFWATIKKQWIKRDERDELCLGKFHFRLICCVRRSDGPLPRVSLPLLCGLKLLFPSFSPLSDPLLLHFAQNARGKRHEKINKRRRNLISSPSHGNATIHTEMLISTKSSCRIPFR